LSRRLAQSTDDLRVAAPFHPGVRRLHCRCLDDAGRNASRPMIATLGRGGVRLPHRTQACRCALLGIRALPFDGAAERPPERRVSFTIETHSPPAQGAAWTQHRGTMYKWRTGVLDGGGQAGKGADAIQTIKRSTARTARPVSRPALAPHSAASTPLPRDTIRPTHGLTHTDAGRQRPQQR
jgi:hypothetical protein